MARNTSSVAAFFELVRGGLWERAVKLAPYGDLDWQQLLDWANEQTVTGLFGAALEHLEDARAPKSVGRACLSQVMGTVARNEGVNALLRSQAREFASAGVDAVVLKGQGVAQCYERPMWRQPGDIDWLLEEDGYVLGREILLAKADEAYHEYGDLKHFAMRFGSIEVELHGSTHTGLSPGIEQYHDKMQYEMFVDRVFRKWDCSGQIVLLPGYNFDAVFIFTHMLHHFYHGGVGLRQVCDWTRFLYRYHNHLDSDRLERDLKAMGLMPEWKAFGSFAVQWLGMDPSAMPFYTGEQRGKAGQIARFLLTAGSFGQKLDRPQVKYKSYLHRKLVSFRLRSLDILRIFRIFPAQSLKFLCVFLLEGFRKTFSGK